MAFTSATSGTLLLIDDDEITLRLLKVNLERTGYSVVLTRTAAEGLAYARHHALDLVLTDAALAAIGGPA